MNQANLEKITKFIDGELCILLKDDLREWKNFNQVNAIAHTLAQAISDAGYVKIEDVLRCFDEVKYPKCGKTYDCDSCPYNNDNECNIYEFNKRIDKLRQALENLKH